MVCSSHKREDRGCTEESSVGADGCLYLRMSAPGFYVASQRVCTSNEKYTVTDSSHVRFVWIRTISAVPSIM